MQQRCGHVKVYYFCFSLKIVTLQQKNLGYTKEGFEMQLGVNFLGIICLYYKKNLF